MSGPAIKASVDIRSSGNEVNEIGIRKLFVGWWKSQSKQTDIGQGNFQRVDAFVPFASSFMKVLIFFTALSASGRVEWEPEAGVGQANNLWGTKRIAFCPF